ncbi:MAG: class I SAM-dependent methyltransferase [Myxococcales bacterium]|nr:class I SAM-dependent methyltransferase [Myxococcales bacterium]
MSEEQDAIDELKNTALAARLPWRDSWRAPLGHMMTWLARFSARTNLVGNHTPRVVVSEHIVETLVVAAVCERLGLQPRSIVDVGAGAGLEALTLALWAEQAQVTVIEPRRKRSDFIELVADAMGVGKRVTVIRDTVPAWRPPTRFDLATSRATFDPETWLAHGRNLLAPGGVVAVHDAANRALGPNDAQPGEWASSAFMAVPHRPAHRIVGYRQFGP